MESSGSRRSGLLTAGGVLSVIAGALQIILGAAGLGLMVGGFMWGRVLPFPAMPLWPEHFLRIIPAGLGILGGLLLALGIVAVIGGAYALRRKNFGMSLAGAICALPMMILGILAVIFVSLSKREFESPKQITGGQGQPGGQQPGGQQPNQ